MTPKSTAAFTMPNNARAMLAEMASMYRYELTDFESMMWEAQVFSQHSDDVVMRALLDHMETPGKDAQFMPHYGKIKNKLEPVLGFLEIESAVRTGSPYKVPDIHDPVVVEAIQCMGGWAKVCSEMPDARERPIDYDRYLKRFEVALVAARNKVNVQGYRPAPLAAIGAPAATALPSPSSHLALEAPAASSAIPELAAPRNAQELAAASRKILRHIP